MLYLYLGTPGSGKSFHVATKIYNLLRNKKVNVIANFAVDVNRVHMTRLGRFKCLLNRLFKLRFKNYNTKLPKTPHFWYWENSDMTIDGLKQFCYDHHKYKTILVGDEEQRIYLEDQTLVVIDEAAVLFNCRQWGDKSRQAWCDFFIHHRKFGFNILLVTQHERLLDRQIRYLVEIYVEHRNAKYWNLPAKILSFLCGGSLFVVLYRWQGCKDIMSRELYRYSSKIASIYNSYLIFKPRT